MLRAAFTSLSVVMAQWHGANSRGISRTSRRFTVDCLALLQNSCAFPSPNEVSEIHRMITIADSIRNYAQWHGSTGVKEGIAR